MRNAKRGYAKLYLKISLAAIFLSLILGYSAYQARNIITGPVIIVDEPQNGSLVERQLAQISGAAKNINKITLDDRQIFVDEAGSFSEKLLLSEGYNIIKIKAWDKFGKKIEKKIELVYKQNGVN